MNRQLKVAFVDYVLEPTKPGRTGLSDVAWDMASQLVDLGHEAHIIGSYHTNVYPDPRVIVHNFPTPPMGYRNIVGQLWLLTRAAKIVKELNPDIVHTPEYVSTALFAILGIPKPIVLTVPGNIFHRLRYGHSYEWHYVQVLKWAARISARRCAAVIAISREMKHWWELTGSPPERTPWIPYGIDHKRFHPVPDARMHLGIPANCLFLLYVGRYAEEKGLLDLVQALAALRSLLTPETTRVTLIGSGPQAKEIQAAIQNYGLGDIVQVHSWVNQDDLKIWYSAADVLLMPSHSEPLGKVMLEAMSCGTPTIASTTEGPNDHVREDINGFLFPVGDIQALTDLLAQVVPEPNSLRRLRPGTLDFAQQHLTWQKVMQRVVEEVYVPIVHASESQR